MGDIDELDLDPTEDSVSGREFRSWRNRFALGYVVLAAAMGAGLYEYSVKNQRDLIHSLNNQRTVSCSNRQINARKFNDFVNDAIKSRLNEGNTALKQGNKVLAEENLETAKRYLTDREHVPTAAECKALLLK